MSKLLQDRDGNPSSKRVMGYILTLTGILEKICLFCKGIKTLELMNNFVNLDTSANWLIIAGASLLGVCVAEFWGKNGNKDSNN